MTSIIKRIQIFHIIYHHKSNLEGEGVIKGSHIKPGALLQLLQTIYERIPVDKKLSGGFRHVQIVLKELVDRCQDLIVQIIRHIFSENLVDEDTAQVDRELVDQSSDSERVVARHLFLRIEDLSSLPCRTWTLP